MNMTNQDQLELGLASVNRSARAARREQRLTRANWWFDQMRQAVDRAFDWEAEPSGQPEQILLTENRARG
jgi:hypothetical protein